MRRPISVCAAVVFAMMSVAASAKLDVDKMFFALTFDDGNGDTATDVSGHGSDGVLDRVDWEKKGKFGGAASLGGNGSVVIEAEPAELSLNDTDFTLAIWTNYAEDPPQGARGSQGFTLIARDEGGGATNKFIWWYSGDGVDFHVNAPGGGVDWIDSDPWVPDLGVWYHWALVREDDAYQHYLDGEEFGAKNAAAAIPEEINHAFNVGWSEGPFFFQGLVDDALITTQALAGDDVGNLVKLGIAGALAVEPAGKLPIVWGRIKSAP